MIASSRYPIAQPLAGGLEAHTFALVQALRARGHDVTLFAGRGSDPDLGARLLAVPEFAPSEAARRDVHVVPDAWMEEHHAYLGLMLDLAHDRAFDVVHNNSIHHLPLAMARTLPIPMITTLHTPPVWSLESALAFVPDNAVFAAVSETMAMAWSHVVSSTVVRNGIDLDLWSPGPGGDRAIWSGRIVPEKGTHLAVRAALAAGVPIDLAGPVADGSYFAAQVAPLIGPDVRYLGHLSRDALARAVGSACAALVTPRWEEPYGLVAAEALSCGTPVAGFDRGALHEIVDTDSGRLCRPDDIDALADALDQARRLDRTRVRARAVESLSIERMVAAYESLYADAVGVRLAS